MKEIAAKESGIGPILDAARRAPVRIAGKDGTVCVAMSLERYERLRGSAWDRLAESIDELRKEAAANGLTDAELEALLADDS
ncbi:MAG: prevent-host-death protein [Alphaproteobacteria bacterium]|nr:prevent-host-death protein [Alphaproteobacteria bacterium]